MDCLHPLAPDNEELIRCALDGERLSAEANRHLEQCSTCQQRLARYKHTHAFLVSRLYRSQCPDSTKLSLYCIDLLPPHERLSIANHIQDCPLCTTEAADARHFLARPDRDLLSSPLFILDGLHATVRRIFAMPVTQQTQLVVRDDVPETAWPRHYQAESVDLLLQLSRASNGELLLLGTITDVDSTERTEVFEGAGAELYPASNGDSDGENEWAETPPLYTHVDDLGNFVFFNAPVGNCVLIIHLPDREVVIERLTLETID